MRVDSGGRRQVEDGVDNGKSDRRRGRVRVYPYVCVDRVLKVV